MKQNTLRTRLRPLDTDVENYTGTARWTYTRPTPAADLILKATTSVLPRTNANAKTTRT